MLKNKKNRYKFLKTRIKLNRYIRFNNKKVKKNRISYRYYTDRLSAKLWYFLRYNKRRKLSLFVKISQNNIFCTLQNVRTKKIIKNCSSGKLKTTKRSLNFNLRIVLTNFLKSFKNYRRKIRFVFIRAPKFFKKKLAQGFFRYHFIRPRIFYFMEPFKCFNGCRALKVRRKKRMKVFAIKGL